MQSNQIFCLNTRTKIQFLNCTYHVCEQRIVRTSLCKFLLIVTNISHPVTTLWIDRSFGSPFGSGSLEYWSHWLFTVIVQDFSRREECIVSNYIHISVINLLIFKKGQLRCFEIWSFHRFCLILLEKT